MVDTMLDYMRFALYAAVAFLGVLLYQTWEKDHPAQQPTAQVESTPANRYAPAMPAQEQAQAQPQAVNAPAATAVPPVVAGKVITVKTDVLDVSIDTLGGDIVGVKLLQYPESLNSTTPFVLFNDDTKTRYIAESGLLSTRGPDTSQKQALYTVDHASYELTPGENSLVVNLKWHDANGLAVTKAFEFTRNSYEIKVNYTIDNQSSQPWQGNLYTQLMRTNVEPESHNGLMNLATYFGAAISSPQKAFEKITFKQMQEKNLNMPIQGGWAAMVQHYFVGAWIPALNTTSNYYSKVMPDGLYAIGMISQPLTAPPHSHIAAEAKLYAGPALADNLERAAPGLKLTVDYGWFWFISGIIFWMMQKIYDVLGNWGWSIVIVTIIIKLLFYQLSAKSYRSMSQLKKLQPRIEALKQRYGDDKQKMTQATLELYREQKVNPMSGCLPVLIQIPVFIALYWVLVESVQLRQAPFIFWIHDLSARDPYYVLPLLMGISMFLQQRLNPPPPDPLQAKIMMFMPVLFTVMFASFPAGLMVYWVVNNTLSFLQQWHIMHRLEKETQRKRD
jgi:YidC/Oxa1 family membrane protein insertase